MKTFKDFILWVFEKEDPFVAILSLVYIVFMCVFYVVTWGMASHYGVFLWYALLHLLGIPAVLWRLYLSEKDDTDE